MIKSIVNCPASEEQTWAAHCSSPRGRLSGTAGTWCQINHALEAPSGGGLGSEEADPVWRIFPKMDAFPPVAERSPLKCQPGLAVVT